MGPTRWDFVGLSTNEPRNDFTYAFIYIYMYVHIRRVLSPILIFNNPYILPTYTPIYPYSWYLYATPPHPLVSTSRASVVPAQHDAELGLPSCVSGSTKPYLEPRIGRIVAP